MVWIILPNWQEHSTDGNILTRAPQSAAPLILRLWAQILE